MFNVATPLVVCSHEEGFLRDLVVLDVVLAHVTKGGHRVGEQLVVVRVIIIIIIIITIIIIIIINIITIIIIITW